MKKLMIRDEFNNNHSNNRGDKMKIFKIYVFITLLALLFVWSCDNPTDIANEDSALSSTELVEITNMGEDISLKANQGKGNGNGGGIGNGGGNGNGSGGNKGVGGGKKGDLYGDMYVILRDDNGVPILTEEGYQQPVDADGNPLPLDEEGHLINEEDAIEVELGRMNVVRSPSPVIERGLGEVSYLEQADKITIDAAGRLVTITDGISKTTDAPRENLALYKELMNNGSLNVSLKPGVTVEHGLESMFDDDTAPDGADMLIAKSFVAGATDKTVPMTIDKIIYTHVILQIEGTIEDNGIEYIDFSSFSYDRSDTFEETYVTVLVEITPGVYELQIVNVYEKVFNRIDYSGSGSIAVYTQASEDSRKVINYIHDNEAPSLLNASNTR